MLGQRRRRWLNIEPALSCIHLFLAEKTRRVGAKFPALGSRMHAFPRMHAEVTRAPLLRQGWT